MFRKLMASHAAKRRVAWGIFALLVMPFAIYGVSTRRLGRPAGVIFGKSIAWEEFQAERAWMLRQLRSQFGEASDALDAMGAFVNQSTWDKLMLAEEAHRRRVRIDDQELAAFIRQIPALQERGRFDRERYRRFLLSTRTTEQGFEQLLRWDLTVERLVNSIKSAVTITDQDVREAYATANEQLTASVIFVDTSAFTAAAASGIAEEALRAAYDAHPEDYRVPEQIAFDYGVASRDDVAPTIQTDDQALEAYYQDHLDQWPKKADGAATALADIREQVRGQLTAERIRKALTVVALDVQDDLDAKKTFEEIAAARGLKRQAAGPLSPDDLFAAGAPEPAVLHAVAKLEEGRMSEVIQTDQGVYLARLTKRSPSHVPPFEEVREKVRERAIKDRAKELARSRAKALHDYFTAKLAAGLRYEEAAVTYDGALPVASFTFTRSGPIGPLGSVRAANAAAFETPLGAITEVLEAPTGFAILRPERRIPPDPSKFAEAEVKLREETLKSRQSARLSEWLRDVRARARLKSFVDASAPEES